MPSEEFEPSDLKNQAAADLRLRQHGHRDHFDLLPADISSIVPVVLL
jgi:hypothetical protein